MSGVQMRAVAPDEDSLRLDRWFKKNFPTLGHGRLQKLLRTGQVRVDGGRAKPGQRLSAGQTVRVPPMDTPSPAAPRQSVGDRDAAFVQSLVVYRDDQVLAVNKPSGLAVQGGSGTSRHLDGMLTALQFDAAEKPRLVHRLDKDTSGVLLLARTRQAAAKLTQSFRQRTTRKIYWAAVVGVPSPTQGKIDMPLAKLSGQRGGERVVVDEAQGKRAVTLFDVVERSGNRLSWLAMWPLTGRTHQLRVHAAEMGTPVLGDGKYGGDAAFLPGFDMEKRLHLHARRIVLPHPSGRGVLQVDAELSGHMAETWKTFNFDTNVEPDVFPEDV